MRGLDAVKPDAQLVFVGETASSPSRGSASVSAIARLSRATE